MTLLVVSSIGAWVGGAAATTPAPYMSGEGESFPQQAISKLLTDAYNANQLGGLTPTYLGTNATGEDGARQSFVAATCDFAVSGAPLTPDEISTAAANGITPAYVPYGIGAVGIAVALTVTNQQGQTVLLAGLRLTIPTLAKIYVGQIVYWNDAEIFNENPGLTYELQHIAVVPPVINIVGREDSSATNSALLAAFRANPAAYSAWKSPNGSSVIPAQGIPPDQFPPENSLTATTGGSAAVAQKMMRINPNTGIPDTQPRNSIGYLSPAWATQYGIPLAAVQNAKGNFLTPTPAAVAAAVPGSTFDTTAEQYAITKAFDYSTIQDPGAYPIPLPSYLILPKVGATAAKAQALAGFVKFALGSTGQQDVATNAMVPVGTDVIAAGTAIADAMIAAATTTTTTSSTTSTTAPTTTTTTAQALVAAGPTTTTSKSDPGAAPSATRARRAVQPAGAAAASGPRARLTAFLPTTGNGFAPFGGVIGLCAVFAGDVVHRRARRSPQ